MNTIADIVQFGLGGCLVKIRFGTRLVFSLIKEYKHLQAWTEIPTVQWLNVDLKSTIKISIYSGLPRLPFFYCFMI